MLAISPEGARADRVNAPSHSLGGGHRSLHFRTEDGGRYLFTGPTLTYDYWVGRRFGFMIHAEVFLPQRGRQRGGGNEYGGALRDQHNQKWGFDGGFFFGTRRNLAEDIDLFVGAGIHLQSLRVNGPAVLPVEIIMLGVAGLARLQYNFTENLHIGGTFELAVDPFDLIGHRNRAVLSVPFTIAFNVGAHYR